MCDGCSRIQSDHVDNFYWSHHIWRWRVCVRADVSCCCALHTALPHVNMVCGWISSAESVVYIACENENENETENENDTNERVSSEIILSNEFHCAFWLNASFWFCVTRVHSSTSYHFPSLQRFPAKVLIWKAIWGMDECRHSSGKCVQHNLSLSTSTHK